MKKTFFAALVLISQQAYSQSIGINTTTPDPSAYLDISGTNKGLLVPRMTNAQRQAIPNPANALLMFQTDAPSGLYYNAGSSFTPSWVQLGQQNNSWWIGGNSLLSTGDFGTTSNNHINLITNNQLRGRLTNLGEFIIGAFNTTIPGDLMAAVSNTTFPFAVNGYSSFNGSGVYGAVQAGTTFFAGIQGDYAGSGAFNTAGVRGSNQNTVAGTGFRTMA
ncbi:MAG: hypothetical protein JNM68_06245, partial [Dinghuibacter sp.]|nr:hypothetical protein [Dinghuibacter sp.]